MFVAAVFVAAVFVVAVFVAAVFVEVLVVEVVTEVGIECVVVTVHGTMVVVIVKWWE